MIFNDVIFPQALTDAIDSQKSAVFAGAGVSMGEPANLGSFWDLATKIAAGTGESPRIIGTTQDGKKKVNIWGAVRQVSRKATT